MTTAYDDFQRVEIRVGRVQRAEPLPEARRPALKLWIDFGVELGVLNVVLISPNGMSPSADGCSECAGGKRWHPS